MRSQIKVPQYDIHPISIKMINRGHPWITKDKFSEKFHPRDRFIIALNKRRPCGLFLHDPTHKFVSARLWAKQGNFTKLAQSFKKDLAIRIKNALKKRFDDGHFETRQNIYLVYGEADQLPGLFVQLLGPQVLIQQYSNFWDNYQDIIIKEVLTNLSIYFDLNYTRSNFWVQKRGMGPKSQSPAKSLNPNRSELKFSLEEFGVKYQLVLGKFYDIGIYTDMASIRAKLTPQFERANKVLNLFAYTGAFSLYALKNNCEVHSVDLSEQYLEWLDQNLNLNEDFDKSKHISHQISVNDFLDKCESKFDLIISDPPSSSSDGQKRTSAIREYEKSLVKMYELLNEDGEMVLFLNTHNIGMNKFKQKISNIIQSNDLKLNIISHLGTAQDCPQMRGFPEGSYLKGLLVRKTDDQSS